MKRKIHYIYVEAWNQGSCVFHSVTEYRKNRRGAILEAMDYLADTGGYIRVSENRETWRVYYMEAGANDALLHSIVYTDWTPYKSLMFQNLEELES